MSTQVIQNNILKRKIYQVRELNLLARNTLEKIVVWVEGEVSMFKQNLGWRYLYLDIKDSDATLHCLSEPSLFKGFDESLIGKKILIYGHLTLYAKDGRYNFMVRHVEAAGEGLLQKKLEELILKLRSEGLFDPKYKQEIPLFPKSICLVTSYDSDAFNDFIKHTIRKFPIINLSYVDVRVQGAKSIGQLTDVLPKVDKLNFDAAVITRGGGSLEDLAAFNDESVARIIFKMKTPTIVAIGHEANESLAEWVADRRASTPTDAANIITQGYLKIEDKLDFIRQKLASITNYYFASNFQRLDLIYFKIGQNKRTFAQLPQKLATIKETLKRYESILIVDAQRSLAELMDRLRRETRVLTKNNDQKLQSLAKSLSLLSYENTLKRGFSITTDYQGRLLRSIKSVARGDIIRVRLADGKITSVVKSKSK